MISLYCWHSSINNLFEIKIGSEKNVNFLKTIYFNGWPSMVPHYAKAAFMKTTLLLFSHEFHTKKTITEIYFWYISDTMIVMSVFILILSRTESRLVHIQKEHCHYDHIPFNFKGIRKSIYLREPGSWVLWNKNKYIIVYEISFIFEI